MNSLFEDLQQGLKEAIAYAQGIGPGTSYKYEIQPVPFYSNADIKRIRVEAKMSQAAFAKCLGVSAKTVEAWECGRTHPTGSARRLMSMISENRDLPFISRVS